jgi:hypothetical protein
MPRFSLRVKWEGTRELLGLDFDTLQKGSPVFSEELWDDKTLVKYEAVVVEISRPAPGSGDKYRVVLNYDGDAPQHRDIERHSEITWGDFVTEIDPLTFQGTAVKADDPEFTALGVRVLDSDLFSKEYETVNRVKRRGQELLRDDLLKRDGGCAITGETWSAVLEAAHIRPASDGGPAHWDNCLLLRMDLHWLFDHHKLEISPEGVVTLAGAPAQSMYAGAQAARLNPQVLERVADALRQRAAAKAGAGPKAIAARQAETGTDEGAL